MFSSTIYILCLAAVASTPALLGAEAASLRAMQAPARSPSNVVVRTRAQSRADIEEVEEEEEVLDQGPSATDQPQQPAAEAPPNTPEAAEMPQQPAMPAQQTPQEVVEMPQLAAMPAQQMPQEVTSLPLSLELQAQQLQALANAPEQLTQQPVAATEGMPPDAHPKKYALPAKQPPLHSAASPGLAPGRLHMGLAATNASVETAFQSAAPPDWPPKSKAYSKCDPPCIDGRGVCNDNVCFCKSPYVGSTCQHEVTGLYRAPQIMVVGFSAACFFLGAILSKFVYAFAETAVEKRLEKYGSQQKKYESWLPPSEDKKKASGG